MRAISGVNIIALLLPFSLFVGFEPAFASCSCLRHAEEDARRSAAQSALSHLPSQSNLVTARLFAGQGLTADAAERYLAASANIEQELAAAANGKLEAAANLPVDAVSFLTEQAINIEEEGAEVLSRSGREGQATELLELAYKHRLDFSDVAPSTKLSLANALAQGYQRMGRMDKTRQYLAIVVDELQRTKGRYDRDTMAAQARLRTAMAQESRLPGAL